MRHRIFQMSLISLLYTQNSAALAASSSSALMQSVLDLASHELAQGGLPFATIVVDKNGKIIAKEVNTVNHTHDPTDHAEIRAIRSACQNLKRSDLHDHDVYVIGHPCPMCTEALKVAKPDAIYFAVSIDAKNKALGKSKDPVSPPMHHMKDLETKGLEIFQAWKKDSPQQAL